MITLRFTVVTLRSFLAAIRVELEEAAEADGCTRAAAGMTGGAVKGHRGAPHAPTVRRGNLMSHSPRRIRVTIAAAAAMGLGCAALTALPTAAASEQVAVGATLFDDFNYTSYTDPAIGAHGWNIRSNSGGPGVPGATWAPQNVTFAAEGTNSVMNLETSTAGTGESTKHAEVLTKAMKFKNGTYAARVKFSDAPISGPDGDHLVQAFFTINDLTAPMADDYAEYDFEYLPNGGWGEPANILYTTSWETYRPDPGRRSTSTPRSGRAMPAGTTSSSPSTTAASRTTSTAGGSPDMAPATFPSGPCPSTSTSG